MNFNGHVVSTQLVHFIEKKNVEMSYSKQIVNKFVHQHFLVLVSLTMILQNQQNFKCFLMQVKY